MESAVSVEKTDRLSTASASADVDIFLSYASENRAFVRKIQKGLVERGFAVWLDVDRIQGGDNWQSEISDGIDACKVFIVIITVESNKSKWVGRECARAERKQKTIVPLLRSDELPIRFENMHYISFQVDFFYKEKFEELVEALEKHLPAAQSSRSNFHIFRRYLSETDGKGRVESVYMPHRNSSKEVTNPSNASRIRNSRQNLRESNQSMSMSDISNLGESNQSMTSNSQSISASFSMNADPLHDDVSNSVANTAAIERLLLCVPLDCLKGIIPTKVKAGRELFGQAHRLEEVPTKVVLKVTVAGQEIDPVTLTKDSDTIKLLMEGILRVLRSTMERKDEDSIFISGIWKNCICILFQSQDEILQSLHKIWHENKKHLDLGNGMSLVGIYSLFVASLCPLDTTIGYATDDELVTGDHPLHDPCQSLDTLFSGLRSIDDTVPCEEDAGEMSDFLAYREEHNRADMTFLIPASENCLDRFLENGAEYWCPRRKIPPALQFPLRTKLDAETRLQIEDFPRTEMKLDRSELLVRIAMPVDAQDCERLAASVSLQGLQQADASEGATGRRLEDTGFLVSGFQAREYVNFIRDAEHFLTLHIGNEMIGFLLAYGSEQIDPNKEELNMHIKTTMCDKFVLLKQICVSPALEHRRKGHATLLYKELFARIQHYYDHEDQPRPIYAAIVKEPANPVSLEFHGKTGFTMREEFTPEVDGRPRYIFENKHPGKSLDKLTTDETKTENCPFYDARAMMDPHCVGIGITMYSIGSPDITGIFHANVRVVMKWRQPGIEEVYPRIGDGSARTDIDVEAHAKDRRTFLRFPRYDLNKHEVEQMQNYAYIDKNDPHDVITWQQVLRGTFSSGLRHLSRFPADLQKLQFGYRMWDSDPDDRCRYFRQQYYVDNTAWPLCIKRHPKSFSFQYLAPEAEIDVYRTSKTSRYTFTIPVMRDTKYYLLSVAIPMLLLTSLNFASARFEGFQEQATFNINVLLATVVYFHVFKDSLPQTSDITMLHIIIYIALFLSWAMIGLRFLSTLNSTSTEIFLIAEEYFFTGVCFVAVGIQLLLCLYLYIEYLAVVRRSGLLGTF